MIHHKIIGPIIQFQLPNLG